MGSGGPQDPLGPLSGDSRTRGGIDAELEKEFWLNRVRVDWGLCGFSMAEPSGNGVMATLLFAPPRFVRHGDLVFLSGNTDISPGFDAQVETIVANIATSLSMAGTQWPKITRVETFVHRSIADARTYASLSAQFPCPILMTGVEGYSAPEKLVEIEVTAGL